MNLPRALVLIVAGIVIFAGGFGLGMQHGSKSREPAAGRRTLLAHGRAASLPVENEGAKAPVRQATTADAKTATAPADSAAQGGAAAAAQDPSPWRVIFDLQRRKLARPSITFVGGAGKLTDEFAQLFALAPIEREKAQQALDVATQRLTELNQLHSTVTRDGDGGLTIVVTSFAQEGGMVYDEMIKAFADTLGADRYAGFMALGADQVERALGRFGAPEQTVQISLKPGPGGAKSYFVQERFKLPQESGTSSSYYSSLDEMKNRLGPIAGVLPPEFGASNTPSP